MKTKEAIRNEIIRYADFAWQTNEVNRHELLVRLMIEEVCNELHLLHNRLDNSSFSIFEKLVKNLSPVFNYIRPAHAVLRVNTGQPFFHIEKETGFHVKNIPPDLKNKGIDSIVFTPVVDLKINNIHIRQLFFGETLWSCDEGGKKSKLLKSKVKAKRDTLWLGLEASPETQSIQDLFFYFEFPHLDDIHEYYDLLADLQWSEEGKLLAVKSGLPLAKGSQSSKIESDVLNFYQDRYQTIESSTALSDMPLQQLPKELNGILSEEQMTSLPFLYWISIDFSPHFQPEDIEKMTIAINAFPVINRHYRERIIPEKEITKIVSLSSGIREEFLETEAVIDSKGTIYNCRSDVREAGTFTIEAFKKDKREEPKIAGYLEKLVDLLQDEKTAFPPIDKDRVMEACNSVSSIRNRENFRMEKNWLEEYSEVARMNINVKDEVSTVKAGYWTSFAGLINGIPEKTTLMANKVSELSKSDASLITPVRGGRSFYDLESLKAVNRFYITSHDRILSKHNIVNFCRMELGNYVESVDAEKVVWISHKRKEGLVNGIEIRIVLRREQVEYLKNSGILKELQIRLKQRSPDTFNYRIVLSLTDVEKNRKKVRTFVT